MNVQVVDRMRRPVSRLETLGDDLLAFRIATVRVLRIRQDLRAAVAPPVAAEDGQREHLFGNFAVEREHETGSDVVTLPVRRQHLRQRRSRKNSASRLTQATSAASESVSSSDHARMRSSGLFVLFSPSVTSTSGFIPAQQHAPEQEVVSNGRGTRQGEVGHAAARALGHNWRNEAMLDQTVAQRDDLTAR